MATRPMDTGKFRRWLPEGEYYDTHVERLKYSFDALPLLPQGFSCLCIGSWGAEVPVLGRSAGGEPHRMRPRAG